MYSRTDINKFPPSLNSTKYSIYKPVDVACAFAVPRIPAADWLVFLSWFLQNSKNNENISELVNLVQLSRGPVSI